MFWMLLSVFIEKQVETDIVDTTSSCFVCRACWQYFNPSYWGYTGLGHEAYLGINEYFYGGGGIARLGFQLSQENGCSHPGISEGVGLKERDTNDTLNSGRLQWDT